MASSPFTFNFPTLNSPSLVDVTTLAKKLDPTACGTPLNLDAVTGFMDDIKLKLDLPSIDLKSALPDLDGFKDELMGALDELKPNLPNLGDSFKDAISELQTLAGPEFAKLKAELQEKWKDVVPDLDNILDSTPDLTALLKGTVDAIDICSVVPEINAKFETIDGVAVATEITKQAQNALTPDKTAEVAEKLTETIVKAKDEVVATVNKTTTTVTKLGDINIAIQNAKKEFKDFHKEQMQYHYDNEDNTLARVAAYEFANMSAKVLKLTKQYIYAKNGLVEISAEQARNTLDEYYIELTNTIESTDPIAYKDKANIITKLKTYETGLLAIEADLVAARKYELQQE